MKLQSLLALLLVGGAPWTASSSAEAVALLRPSARPAKGEQGASPILTWSPFL